MYLHYFCVVCTLKQFLPTVYILSPKRVYINPGRVDKLSKISGYFTPFKIKFFKV